MANKSNKTAKNIFNTSTNNATDLTTKKVVKPIEMSVKNQVLAQKLNKVSALPKKVKIKGSLKSKTVRIRKPGKIKKVVLFKVNKLRSRKAIKIRRLKNLRNSLIFKKRIYKFLKLLNKSSLSYSSAIFRLKALKKLPKFRRYRWRTLRFVAPKLLKRKLNNWRKKILVSFNKVLLRKYKHILAKRSSKKVELVKKTLYSRLKRLGLRIKPINNKITAKFAKKRIANKVVRPRWWSLEQLGEERGVIRAIRDSIVFCSNLDEVQSNELLYFWQWKLSKGPSMFGVALNLEENLVKSLAFGNDKLLKVGMRVVRTYRVVNISVDPKRILGRVIDPLAKPLDGLGRVRSWELRYGPTRTTLTDVLYSVRKIEIKAPGVIERKKVTESLETGIKMVDVLVPIGRGQRELIIGDKKTGKTTIAIDAILNQRTTKFPVICVYVAIGKRMAEVVRIIRILKQRDALKYTIVLVSRASDPASLQFIAPYSGCTISEYFMLQGKASLIVYDDLTRHADVYRQIALLLRRPVGREAYPGDVFYLHSRLLERSAKLRDKLYKGGSLTALPVVETLQGDVSAYIPTNIISITDGQIYLDGIRHQEGLRPAVDPGISVSRIGSAAQSKVMKSLAGVLKLKLAQFREVEGFVKFGLDLDSVTKRVLNEGLRLTQMLKQAKNAPVQISKQIVLLYSGYNGSLDEMPVSKISSFETYIYDQVENSPLFKPFKYIGLLKLDHRAMNVLLRVMVKRFAS